MLRRGPRRSKAVTVLVGLVALALLAPALALVASPGLAARVGIEPLMARTRYVNPVIKTDFADPTVLHASDGWYYAYSTEQLTIERMAYFQVARSPDLAHWELLPDAMPRKPSWTSETRDFWAPGVIEADGTYYLYFGALPNDRRGMCLGVATARAPAGPFIDSGRPLRCGEGFVNIDPMPFDDPATGKRLLYWGSDDSPILVQELAPDRISFLRGTEPTELVHTEPYEPYEGLVEAPWVVRHDDWYYLFYSGDNCCDRSAANYAVMVARSRAATGPFEKPVEAGRGPGSNVLLEFNERWEAPGHNAVVVDGAGDAWILYHAIDRQHRFQPAIEAVRRPMLMDRIVWEDGWPRVEGGPVSAAGAGTPSTEERPGPARP